MFHGKYQQLTPRQGLLKKRESKFCPFLRIHRSFIINKNRLKSFSYDQVLVDDIQLNIGRTYRKQIKESLGVQ
ncbi:LytTR family transcriptional regulator DNA-binding domain-containing protein [Labilibaculum sp. K2S]|uniref:LytTR family transcriptional regulator DNA-binding domain-containing protein n=1 Tax=Labilibaculum sp. K2S TaxID=3056386 RepID=UPI003FA52BBF